MKKSPKQVKKLCIIWIAAYLILGSLTNIYMICVKVSSDALPDIPFSIRTLFSMAAVAFFFIPFAIKINRQAKAAEMKKIAAAAKVISVLFSIWLFLVLATSLLSLLFPELLGGML